jgi:putative transposase
MRYQELAFWLCLWKRSEEYGFLRECHSQVLQQKLMDLDRAFRDAFDKGQSGKRLPVFKKKGQHDSFRYCQGFRIEKGRLFLPKIGWVRFFQSREITGTVKNVTVSRKGKHWYISVQAEQEVPEPRHPATTAVGVDMGVSLFATLSSGVTVAPVNSFKKHQARLGYLQRGLARKEKYSSHWKKQRLAIQKLHERIANIRNDFLHKCSTGLSKNHAMIAVEDLQVRNMSQSARGSLAHPGRNVRAKSGLNRAILDQGWGEFRRQLTYKQAWRGGILVEVPARNTSVTCHHCGHAEKGNRRSQSEFCCLQCGHEANADINAARNILAAGHAALACGAGAVARP